MPDLPPFNELSVDLKLYADSGAQAFAAGEVLLARGGWAGGLQHSMAELRRSALASGAVYAFFRWAGATPEREQLIRDFIAGLDAATDEAKADNQQRGTG